MCRIERGKEKAYWRRTVTWLYLVASERPRMRRVSWMSFTITVTRRECIAHKFESSNKRTR